MKAILRQRLDRAIARQDSSGRRVVYWRQASPGLFRLDSDPAGELLTEAQITAASGADVLNVFVCGAAE